MKRIRKTTAALLCVCLLLAGFGGLRVGAVDKPRAEPPEPPPADCGLSVYRKPFEPVRVTLDGQSYNLVNPIQAIQALIAAGKGEDFALKYVGLTYLEWMITDVLSLLAAIIPASNRVLSEKEFQANDPDKGFMPGSAEFTQTPGDHWELGFAQASLLPDDILTAEQKYYLAGFFNGRLPEGRLDFPGNDVKAILDDMMVRAVALDVGQGTVVLASIDCIGIANADVRKIRLMLADLIEAEGIVSINIFATHTHSCLDTLGLWNPFLGKAVNNIGSHFLPWLSEKSGPDEEFMRLLRARTADAIRAAVADKKPGELFSAAKDVTNYMSDKRQPQCVLGDMTRLRFAPTNPAERPTMIINMSAHPDTSGLMVDDGKSEGTDLTADYPYYIAEQLEKQGYNCLFINGAIAGVDPGRGPSEDGLDLPRRHGYTVRYGRELGWIALSMCMTQAEIEAAPWVDHETIAAEQALSNRYTLWYDNWQPVEEKPVAPILNIRLAQVDATVEHPLIVGLGKLGLVNHNVFRAKDGTFRAITELGYMELGNELKIAFFPGEVLPELIVGGGACEAEYAFTGMDFPLLPLNEIAGANLLLFGLANDTMGYIIPDTDYTMSFVDSTRQNSNQELVSFGRHIGSTLVKAFANMMAEF